MNVYTECTCVKREGEREGERETGMVRGLWSVIGIGSSKSIRQIGHGDFGHID